MVEGLEAIAGQLPFSVLGIDSDNDGAFINDTPVQYCVKRAIEFTRSRAYRKNDQAWIEQKNGSAVRRFTGHDRYSGQIAGQTMVHLYKAVRLNVNYFQPSFKLLEKIRGGAKAIKRYSPPATPCDRVMQHDEISATVKKQLRECRAGLDPVVCQGRRQNIPVGRSKSVPPERSLASVNVRASCSGEVSQRQAGNRLGG